MSFREMRRSKQKLTDVQCVEVLTASRRGVLAVSGDEDYPYAVPMNYVYDDGCIYFHGAKVGHKVDVLKVHPKASFCVLDNGEIDPGDIVLHFQSVIAFGRMELVEDHDEHDRYALLLGLKYFPDEKDELMQKIAVRGESMYVWRFTIEHMTGKLVYEI